MKLFGSKYTLERIMKDHTSKIKGVKLHKCLRCPALIKGSAKYCMPCSADVRAERK